MSANLQFVPIPGLADAVRRESSIRRKAWSLGHTTICDIPVRWMTVQDVCDLEELNNGFFAPWRFDTEEEFLTHCAQLVWWLSLDLPKRKAGEPDLVWNARVYRHRRTISRLALRDPGRLAREVTEYIKDQFMDSPKGESDGGTSPVAASPAYVMDALAAGGYVLTPQQVLEMPLVRVWQLIRLTQRRLYHTTLTNPSDKLATDYLASMPLNAGAN